MGEAKRRKLSGDYPNAQIQEEPQLIAPVGRKVGIVGHGMRFGTLAALLAISTLNSGEEVNPQ